MSADLPVFIQKQIGFFGVQLESVWKEADLDNNEKDPHEEFSAAMMAELKDCRQSLGLSKSTSLFPQPPPPPPFCLVVFGFALSFVCFLACSGGCASSGAEELSKTRQWLLFPL